MKQFILIGYKSFKMTVIDSYKDFSITGAMKEFRLRNDFSLLKKKGYDRFSVSEERRYLE